MSEAPAARPRNSETVIVLDPSQVRARMDEKGRLEVSLPDGSVHQNARVTLAFPISRPKSFIYLMAEDGTELGVIGDPRRMERETRDLLLDQADQAYFMPRITKVLQIDENMGIAHWEVETDRGWSTFDVVARTESHWYVGRDKVVVRDADGNRYLIEALSALDGRSRRMLDLYL